MRGFEPVTAEATGGYAVEEEGNVIFTENQADEVERMLNKDSGLKGLAGTGDMRALLAREDAEARFGGFDRVLPYLRKTKQPG